MGIHSLYSTDDIETVSDECIEWREILDSSNDVAFLERKAWEYLPKVKGPCQVELYNALGEIYQIHSKLDSAYQFYNTASVLADSLQAWNQMITTLGRKASYFYNLNRNDDALLRLDSIKTILDLGYAQNRWRTYYSYMASFYDYTNDYHKAILYTDSALMNIKAFDIEAANDINNKGVYYMRLGDYKNAIPQFLEAIRISQVLPSNNLGANYFLLGHTYNQTKQYKASTEALEKALAITQKNSNTSLELQVTISLIRIYRITGKEQKAIDASEKALELSEIINNPLEKSKTYVERAIIEDEYLQNKSQALYYYNKAYDVAKGFSLNARFGPTKDLAKFYIEGEELENARIILEELSEISEQLNRADYHSISQKLLSQYYEKLGQTRKALKHFKAFHELNDSINNKDVLKQTAYFEKQFDTKQKEIDILELNEINRKQKIETLEAKSLQRKYLLGALGLGALFILGLYSSLVLNKQKKSLTKAHEKLTELNGINNRLFSIIGHDLRGLITPFQRTGKILSYHLGKGNTDRALEISNDLENNANQLSTMLDNLLKWSIDQMDGFETKVEEMDVKDELESIVASFQEIARYKSTQIQLLGNLKDTVLIDKNAFHIIMRNLIGNALKYTENGQVQIDWNKTSDVLELNVTDTGIGIDQRQINELFKLANKEQKMGTKGEKGTGLGLHLVYQFIKKLDGQINVQSELNKGTTFSLEFPAYAAS